MTSSTPDDSTRDTPASASDDTTAPEPVNDEATASEASADDTTASGPAATEPSIWDNPPVSPLPEGYYTEDGTPTFDAVRDRINQRSAAADGHEVLDGDLPAERDFRREQEQLKEAGADRLAQIRKSMGLDK